MVNAMRGSPDKLGKTNVEIVLRADRIHQPERNHSDNRAASQFFIWISLQKRDVRPAVFSEGE
jgi:hypothetical protein